MILLGMQIWVQKFMTFQRCRRRAHNEDWLVGLSDVAFASTNQSCIVASDLEYPTVAVWDTRGNDGLPVRELRFGVHGEATCLQYSKFGSDQVIYINNMRPILKVYMGFPSLLI